MQCDNRHRQYGAYRCSDQAILDRNEWNRSTPRDDRTDGKPGALAAQQLTTAMREGSRRGSAESRNPHCATSATTMPRLERRRSVTRSAVLALASAKSLLPASRTSPSSNVTL